MNVQIKQFTPLRLKINGWAALVDVSLDGEDITNFILLEKGGAYSIKKPLACKREFDESIMNEIYSLVCLELDKSKEIVSTKPKVVVKKGQPDKKGIKLKPDGYYLTQREMEAKKDHRRMDEVREKMLKDAAKVSAEKKPVLKHDPKELSAKEKEDISKQHLDPRCSWVDDKGIKAMRKSRYFR